MANKKTAKAENSVLQAAAKKEENITETAFCADQATISETETVEAAKNTENAKENISKTASQADEENISQNLETGVKMMASAGGISLAEAVEGMEEGMRILASAHPLADLAARRVYVYIGPSIKGIVTNGSVFYAVKHDIVSEIRVRAKAARTEELMKNIERLIVEDRELSSAKSKLQNGKNSLSIAYTAIITWKEHD